jgi:hypothetical protein
MPREEDRCRPFVRSARISNLRIRGGFLADGPGDHNHGPVASCSLGFGSDSASNMGPASLNRHMGLLARQNQMYHFLCTVHDKIKNYNSRV